MQCIRQRPRLASRPSSECLSHPDNPFQPHGALPLSCGRASAGTAVGELGRSGDVTGASTRPNQGVRATGLAVTAVQCSPRSFTRRYAACDPRAPTLCEPAALALVALPLPLPPLAACQGAAAGSTCKHACCATCHAAGAAAVVAGSSRCAHDWHRRRRRQLRPKLRRSRPRQRLRPRSHLRRLRPCSSLRRFRSRPSKSPSIMCVVTFG